MKEELKQKWNKISPYILIASAFLASLMILLIIIDQWILPGIIHSGDPVKVPYLIGKNIETAKQILSDADLDIEKVIEQYSETVPAGQVINQIPKPGIFVKEGRNLYITVSKGKETVKMPFLIGQALSMARRTLQKNGLNLGEVTYAFSEGYGGDTVIIQSVNAGQDIVYGASVNIVVSRGSEQQVSVPNLIGLSYSEALSLIVESGLIIGGLDSARSDTYMSNTIIGQTPAAGEMASKNSLIKLTITK